MKKFITQIFILLGLVFVLLLPYFVFAAAPNPVKRLNDMQPATGYAAATEYSIAEIVGYIVNSVVVILGMIFTGLIVYAGYNWMTAAGDEGKVRKAGDTIRQAIIGLIILAGSWAIYLFIFDQLI